MSVIRIISFVLALVAGGCQADEIRLPGSKSALPRSYFGIHIHRPDTSTPWPVVRFGVIRFWDMGVDWAKLEPAKGQWKFDRLDKFVSMAEERGLEPMLTLGISPRWAASEPDREFVYGKGGNSPPRNMADWEDYVRQVATRYKGRIRLYELWNEPTFVELEKNQGFYYGSAKTLAELGQIAHRVIKSVDPANRLISPPFTDHGARLDLFLSSGGKESVDIIGHHFYADRPEHMLYDIGLARGVMAKHGLSALPLWNTETGYSIVPSGKDGPRDDAEFGGFIARSLVIAAAAGLERFYWYSWEDVLLRTNRQSGANPVVTAFSQTVRWLNGVDVRGCVSRDHQLWICELGMGERKAWMVWHKRDKLTWNVPVDWKARQYETLDARLVNMDDASSIEIGTVPVLVKADTVLWSIYTQHPAKPISSSVDESK